MNDPRICSDRPEWICFPEIGPYRPIFHIVSVFGFSANNSFIIDFNDERKRKRETLGFRRFGHVLQSKFREIVSAELVTCRINAIYSIEVR